MKNYKSTRIALMLVSASVLGATSLFAGVNTIMPAPAPAPESAINSGFYISTDIGANLISDLKPRDLPAGVSGKVSLDPGIRWDVSMGYAFKLADNLSIAPEIETGIIYNSLDKASASYNGFSGSASLSGDLIQVPLQGNIVVNWEFARNFVLYAGGGCGGDFSYLNLDSIDGINVSNYGNTNSSESDFAWQAFGGVKYQIGRMDLGVGYKYLGLTPTGLKTVANSDIMVSCAVHF